jgi:hypothetical protein
LSVIVFGTAAGTRYPASVIVSPVRFGAELSARDASSSGIDGVSMPATENMSGIRRTTLSKSACTLSERMLCICPTAMRCPGEGEIGWS